MTLEEAKELILLAVAEHHDNPEAVEKLAALADDPDELLRVAKSLSDESDAE